MMIGNGADWNSYTGKNPNWISDIMLHVLQYGSVVKKKNVKKERKSA